MQALPDLLIPNPRVVAVTADEDIGGWPAAPRAPRAPAKAPVAIARPGHGIRQAWPSHIPHQAGPPAAVSAVDNVLAGVDAEHMHGIVGLAVGGTPLYVQKPEPPHPASQQAMARELVGNGFNVRLSDRCGRVGAAIVRG